MFVCYRADISLSFFERPPPSILYLCIFQKVYFYSILFSESVFPLPSLLCSPPEVGDLLQRPLRLSLRARQGLQGQRPLPAAQHEARLLQPDDRRAGLELLAQRLDGRLEEHGASLS